ncbi:TonB-dependent receptor [Hymenobacter saemangeumensis]|uniref:TonB-dependent receptor n=2 Tax=Hymenobacter saemangeumensis TaxID=1084522 RepID=A0ABP8I6Z3_9BACT
MLAVWGALALPVRAQSSPGQPGSTTLVSGRVSDHETGELLPGATILLVETQQATQTDLSGNYQLQAPAGLYHVQVRFVGYALETVEVRLLPGRTVLRNFRLHSDAVLLQGAVVRGHQPGLPGTQATATLSGEALRQTSGQALGEALQKISGVSVIQTGANVFKPVIHGLHSNRISILNNGVRQEGQQWGQEHGPEIDPFIASQLTVVKGAASVRHGSDAIGGVVLVEPAPLPDSAGTSAELQLVGMSNNGLGAASAAVQGSPAGLPALRWRVQGTAKRAGNTRTPDYYQKNTGQAELNYSAALGWHKDRYGVEAFFSHFGSKLGILSSAHLGSREDFEAAVARPRPRETADFSYKIDRPYQYVAHDLLKLSGFVKTGLGRLSATLARQQDLREEYDKYRPYNDALAARNLPELRYENSTTTAELLLDHRPLGNFTGSVGLAGTYQDNTYAFRYFVPFYTNVVGGAFLIEHWHGRRWQLEAGLRADYRHLQVRRGRGNGAGYYVERTAFTYVTPAASLGTSFEAGPHLTLRSDLGLTRRAPAPNERYSQGVHNAQYEEGFDLQNDFLPAGAPRRSLQPETAYNTGLTATWHGYRRLNGEVTLYHTRISGYIYQLPMPPPVTIRGVFPSFRFDQSDASFTGFDAAGTYDLAQGWQLAGKAAVVVAYNHDQRDYLIFGPADRLELSLRRSWPNRTATPGRLRQRYAQLSGLGVRRQTRTPSEVYDFTTAPAGYVLLGAEVGATLQLGRLPLTISLTGSNLLDQRYRDYLNRYRYFTDEMGRNITLRLRVPLAFGAASR